MLSVSASSAVSMPSTNTLPSVGKSNALRCFASVDLPLPLCPTTATNSPSFMVRDTLFSAFAAASSYA